MSDEELHIKIVVDDSAIKDTTGDLKKGFTQGGDAAGKMSEQTKMLMGELSKLTHLNLGSILGSNLGAIKNSFKNVTVEAHKLKKAFSDAFAAPGNIKKANKQFKEAFSDWMSANANLKDKQNFANKDIPSIVAKTIGTPDADKMYGKYQKNKMLLQNWQQKSPKAQQDMLKKAGTNLTPAEYEQSLKDYVSYYQKEAAKYGSGLLQRQKAGAAAKKAGDIAHNAESAKSAAIQGLKAAPKALGTAAGGLVKALSAALGPIGLIIIALTVVTKIVKKIKSTIQDINKLWKESLQNNISTQYNQQLQYLQEYLGVSQEQLAQMLADDNEEIVKLLKKQAKLGGVQTNDQIQAIKQLNQATTDFKTAWNGLWTNVAATLAPILEGITKALTWLVTLYNTNDYAEDISAEYADNLEAAWYYSSAIKKNLMGFDELNLLGANSSTLTLNGQSESQAKRDELEAEYQQELAKDKEYRQQKIAELDTFNGESIDALGNWWDSLMSTLQAKITLLAEKFKTTKLFKILNLFPPGVFSVFTSLFENLINLALDLAGKVGLVLGDVIRVITGLVETIIGLFKGIITGDWTLCVQGLKDIWKGFANIFVDILNAIIDSINSLINFVGEVEIFGKSLNTMGKGNFANWRIPEIPRLAKGGVAYGPTTALIGEYAGASSNPEIVAPQSILKETIDASNGEMASVYAQVGRQIIQAINQKDLSVSIGDKDVAEATNRYNNQYRRITGKALLTI